MQAISLDVSQVGVSGSGRSHGLPLVSPDLPSAGFTAVNGISARNTSFRPDDTAQRALTSPDGDSPFRTMSTVTAYGWRPDHSSPPQGSQSFDKDDINTSKRKRSDLNEVSTTEDGQAGEDFGDRNKSPKRRLMTLDSAVDLTSPENPNQPVPSSPADAESTDVKIGSAKSELSPVERWNKGDPPPKPRPEVEATLAASVFRFQQGKQQIQDTLPRRSASPPKDTSSPIDADDVGDSHEHSDDYGGGAPDDPKKRKRVFSNRTKTGCHTCRQRKKKCDEEKPKCSNCIRGNFECLGYGPKPPAGLRPLGPAGAVAIPLMSKTPMTTPNGPVSNHSNNNHPLNNPSTSNHPMSNAPANNQPVNNPSANNLSVNTQSVNNPPANNQPASGQSARPDEGLSYSHWGRVPSPPPPTEAQPPRQLVNVVPPDSRPRPSTADNWQKPPGLHPQERPPYHGGRLPTPNFPLAPPLQPPYGHDHRHHHTMPPNPQTAQPPPPPPPPPPSAQQPPPFPYHAQPMPPLPPQHHRPPPPPPAPAFPVEPWTPALSTGLYLPHPGSSFSSRDSIGTSSSHRSGRFGLNGGLRANAEKEKMLRGEPFRHLLDKVLIQDRSACKSALERYNKADETTSQVSLQERARFFNQILMPSKRPPVPLPPNAPPPNPHIGPEGTCGGHTIVESPFRCEYGYNLHIAEDCVVQSGCYFQDAADIYIGNRTMISHNVKIWCITVGLDPTQRKGTQSKVIAGAVRIDDDVFIGADVTVLPFVTIGAGAVVGAGSVVTKDVEKNTVVAGNPARLIRRIEGSNMGRHHSQQIQAQQEKMREWMTGYANSGYSWYSSPRL